VVFEQIFFNESTLIFAFGDKLPFKRGMALHLNKSEFPLPKNDLQQVCFKQAC
jgi:hypothetical protein